VGLPTQWPAIDPEAVHAAMFFDKKRSGKTVRFIIPQALGDVVMIDDPGREVVRRALDTVLV
jgi:3-dehydroquinate synthetase